MMQMKSLFFKELIFRLLT